MAFGLKAQLTADFSADTTKGCVPQQITFTDLSTGPRAVIWWSWDFGNSGFSNLQNPSRIYPTPGVYTVTLTVFDGVDTARKSKTAYIEVFKNPVANFTFTSTGKCKPVTVTFKDATTLGDAPIKSYSYDFGDLTTPGGTKNPVHTYKFRGTYSAILTVIDTNGCKGVSVPQNISVHAPEPYFLATPRSDCLPPLTVKFTNSTKGDAPLTYSWNFGDGNSSTSPNPTHTYTKAGVYDVTLIATDKFGCKDTFKRKRYISIGKTKADFTIPDTVCLGSSDTVFNASTGARNYSWKFSNGGTSKKENPVVSFSKSGLFTITLVASAGTGCIDSISKTIYVRKLVSNFIVSQDSICKPEWVSFKDSSVGAFDSSYYEIDKGSGNVNDTIYGKNVGFNFPRSPCRNTYWVVNHYIVSKSGCISKSTKRVKIWSNQLTATINATSACAPATFTFTANKCLRYKDVKWHWNFNTGNPADTSNLQNPINQITKTSFGEYFATLTVTDSAGCKHVKSVPYKVGEKPKADFYFPNDTICYGDTVKFQNRSTDSTKITGISWRFGNGAVSTDWNFKSPFNGVLGRVKLQLFAWSHTCFDTATKYIYVSGPIATLKTIPDCKNKLQQTFEGGITHGNRFRWIFGDGSPDDTSNLRVSHTYASIKKYKLKFITYNDTSGCKDTIKYEFKPSVLKAEILVDSNLVCKGHETKFNGSRSLGVAPGNYWWNFGDGNTDQFISRPKHTYPKSGVYWAQLVVMSADSCRDTAKLRIKVTSPNVDFNIGPILCKADTYYIANQSKPDTLVYKYRWDLNEKFYSNDTSISHYFAIAKKKYDSLSLFNTDTFLLKLWAKDTLRCKDSVEKVVYLNSVVAEYEVIDSTICRSDTISFYDTRLPSTIQHKWFFGNGDSSIAQTPKIHYGTSGKFNSKYVVTDGFCSDTAEKLIEVQGIDSVNFSVNIRDTNCYPATIYFKDLSQGDSISWITWDFGDGLAPIRSPLRDSLAKTYRIPGLFNVKAKVETSFGCTDSIEFKKYIDIKGPYATFSIFPDSVCTHEQITFKKDSANKYVSSLVWDFADGRVDTTTLTIDTLKHSYTRTGTLLAILLFEDTAGLCKKIYTKEIVVEDVHANFIYDVDSAGCEPFTTAFKDQGIDGDTWSWNFNDGNSSAAQNPQNTFEKDGGYWVNLLYSNSRNGCVDSAKRFIKVFDTPIVSALGDTTVCLADSADLNATGAKSYVWSPQIFINDTTIQTPRVAPDSNKVYTVVGTDTNGCKASSSTLVLIQRAPIITLPDNQQIIIGEDYQIDPQLTYGDKYRWDPPEGLSCNDCPNPIAQPVISTEYTLYVTDSLGCFESSKSFKIEVVPKFSVDVPGAFSPNGDGVNDLIFPNGWGIKQVLEFKVFNRWGEKIFEATENEPAWDGYYKGELQNIETYVYYVKVISYTDEVLTKEGYFSLLR